MKSFLPLALISLITLGSISLVSCCKPVPASGSHHGHHKMHHEHGDK